MSLADVLANRRAWWCDVSDNLPWLRSLPDNAVHCWVTSPPYFGLRDYGTSRWEGGSADCDHRESSETRTARSMASSGLEGGKENVHRSHQFRGVCGKCGARRVDAQIGLEETPEAYVARLVEVFAEVRRATHPSGVCWLNLGDSFSAVGKSGGGKQGERWNEVGADHTGPRGGKWRPASAGYKPKDLLGIPWMAAFALRQSQERHVVKREADRAWLAAFIDGEGTIGIRRYASHSNGLATPRCKDGFVTYLSASNNDIELLDRCREITGTGRVGLKQKANTTDGRGIKSRRDNYSWRVESNAALGVLTDIYPFLIAKKKQAIIAYNLMLSNAQGKQIRGNGPLPASEQEKREEMKRLIQRCNQRESVDLPTWMKLPVPQVEPGWYLRQWCPWVKRNSMPESVADRPGTACECVFLLAKSEDYFFDMQAVKRGVGERWVAPRQKEKATAPGHPKHRGLDSFEGTTRNLRSADLWFDSVGMLFAGADPYPELLGLDVTLKPYKGAHFAVFPAGLVEPLVLAGSSARGVCSRCGEPWRRVVTRERVPTRPGVDTKVTAHLGGDLRSAEANGWNHPQVIGNRDPQRHCTVTRTAGWEAGCSCAAGEPVPAVVGDLFTGSGTVAAVAVRAGRRFVGCELNPEYHPLIHQRVERVVPEMFPWEVDASLVTIAAPAPACVAPTAEASLFDGME